MKTTIMLPTASLGLAAAVLLLNGLTSHCSAAAIYYIDGPNSPASQATFQAVTYNGFPTKGIAFTAGPSGPFTINTINFMGKDPLTHSAFIETFTLDLRNTTSTTPGSARAGTTLYASDTVSLLVDTTTAFVTYYLTTADLPNISAYSLIGGQSYSLSLYNSSNVDFALGRTTGSNYAYTTAGGFTVLGTISNDNPNPSGPTMSFSMDIGYLSAVPEPSEWAAISFGVLGMVWVAKRRFMPARA